MKKVFLIGDSIRMSYWQRVAELLEGQASVAAPDENCRFSSHTLFFLRKWLGEEQYDVIQWNNGQWDTARMMDGKPHTALAPYLDNTQRIAEILAPRTKHLIFATTTPVHDDMTDQPVNPRSNEAIDAYNEAARGLLEPMGVAITDLNAALRSDVKQYVCDDRVHLTPEGVEQCATVVANQIKPLLQ